MNAKHTPGPWAYIGNGDIVARSEKYCGGEKDIASVFMTTNDEDEANARLIAAAPDLLKALNEIVSQIDQGGSGGKVFSRDACIAQARAAIAKVTGGAT